MDSFRKDTGIFLTAILNGTNYAIIAVDRSGIIKTFNAGAERMLGYTAEELVDKESVLILHDRQEIIRRDQKLYPEELQTDQADFESLTNKASTNGIHEDEWTYQKKDGSMIPVLISISCIRDETGGVRGYVEIAQDITKRKDHELTLLRYKNSLEEIERISKVGGWEIDLINRRLFWSKEVYHIHEKPYDFVPDFETAVGFYDQESLVIIKKVISDCIEFGTPYDIRISIISAAGNKKYIRTKGEAIREQGKTIKVVGVFQDITREHEAEELLKEYALDLEKKNRELDQFAYVVSHDLKAPLRGIHNLSTWIEEDIGDKIAGDTARNFELLRKRVNRMENLINGILAYSKAGRSKNEAVYFSTYELVHDVISALTIGTNVQANIIQPMPFVHAEKIKLEQVFSNLVSNAVKYNNSTRPAITITASENESSYTFCVADNGPGIDPAHHQKIFVIFQTLQSRDTFENTGVGLAIVKKIVEENGGAVWVDSIPGKGAKFCFTWLK